MLFELISQRIRYIKNHNKRKYAATLVSALIVFALVILPDVLAYLIFPNYYLKTFSSGHIYFLGLLILFETLKQRGAMHLFLTVLFLIQLTYFTHFLTNGNFISPYSIAPFFLELKDSFKSIIFIRNFAVVFFVLGSVYYMASQSLKQFDDIRIKNYIAYIPLLAILVFAGLKYSKKSAIEYFMPKIGELSVRNGAMAYVGYLFKRKRAVGEYFDYEVYSRKVLGKKNVVLIIVENLSPKRLQLFGYERENTPYLSSLVDKNEFYAKVGITSSHDAGIMRGALFNLQAEPDNRELLSNNQNHLFRKAKEQGFKTVFISSQKDKILSYLEPLYIDELVTRSSHEELADKRGDEMLVDVLKQTDLQDKNFIVLYMSSLRPPFFENYEHSRTKFEKYSVLKKSADAASNAYDNNVFYVDHILKEVFQFFAGKEESTHIFITSNKAETFRGKEESIDDLIAKSSVPMLYYCHNCPSSALTKFKALYSPCHYDLAKMVAAELGYYIVNPNTPSNVCYIKERPTSARIVKVKKDEERRMMEFSPIL